MTPGPPRSRPDSSAATAALPAPPRSVRSHPTPQQARLPQLGMGPAAIIRVKKLFAAETSSYFVVLGTTLFLVVFGLIMVLSSSAVESFRTNGDFFSSFVHQGVFSAIGIPLMLIAARMRASFWKRWSGTLLVVAIGLQFLTVATPLGSMHGGNTNWISIGGFTGQPSELVKVALVIWLGYTLSRNPGALNNWRDLIVPLVPVVGVAIGLVLFGGDMGTSIILTALVLGAVFFAGVKLRYLAIPIVVLGFGAAIVSMMNISRSARVSAYLSGCPTVDSYSGLCWQTVQGWWALASGGIFGSGLGNSKAKYSWLPEADNDFIFAIIGEELGLLGAILVLVLFIVLTISFIRIIRTNTDPFAKITVSAVMVWIVGQAFVNIAVVLGVLPVLGVPLPLISAGGSALVTTLIGIGIVLSFARHAPATGENAGVAVGFDARGTSR